MEEQKKAKYFCEGCGSEVAPNAKFCPKCGKFFAAVRCPKCGHVGTVRNFLNGCPSCSYAMTSEELYGTGTAEPSESTQHSRTGNANKKMKKAAGRHASFSLLDDVPAWLFIASILALLAVFVLFFMRCKT